MTVTTIYPRRIGASTIRRTRPSGLDRAVMLLGLAMVRAARRHADRRVVSYEEHRIVLAAQRRQEQSIHRALLGRTIL